MRIVSFFGLMESTPAAAPASGPMMLDTWLSAAEGDASGLWFASLVGDLLFPKMFVWGQYAAVAQADAQAARDYFSSGGQERGSNLGVAATAFGWGGGRLADAWPAAPDENEYSQVRTSNVETLLIGGELDFSTPPQIATKELLPYLPNGHQVVLPGIGHTGVLLGRAAGSRQPADQHLLRQRQGRRLALQAAEASTSRPRSRTRRSPRSSSARWSVSRCVDRALAALDGPPGAQARRASAARRARRCGRCTRSSSAWAAGSSAP